MAWTHERASCTAVQEYLGHVHLRCDCRVALTDASVHSNNLVALQVRSHNPPVHPTLDDQRNSYQTLIVWVSSTCRRLNKRQWHKKEQFNTIQYMREQHHDGGQCTGAPAILTHCQTLAKDSDSHLIPPSLQITSFLTDYRIYSLLEILPGPILPKVRHDLRLTPVDQEVRGTHERHA